MTLPAPTYDLVLLLDPQADDATREKLLADTRAAIEAQGELLRHDRWGERALAYPIEHKTSAEYHLLQFHVATTELLSGLNRTLHLADDVIRFRIVKLAPGVGAPPDMASSASAARRPDADPAGAPQSTVAPAAPGADEAPAAEPAAAEAESPAAEVAIGEPS